MKIKEALDLLLDLKNNTSEKSTIKIYNKFIGILKDLEIRDLTAPQIISIETEIDTLDLNFETDDRKKYFSKKLAKFEKYLRDTLSLISEGYFMGYGMVYGMLAGVIFQYFFGVYAIIGGVIFGMAIGAFMDSKAQKQGRVIKARLTP